MSAPELPPASRDLAGDAPSVAPSVGDTTLSAPACPPPLGEPSATDSRLPWLPRGFVVDDYEIVRQLGAGAFARVYLARQISLDRLVALKVSHSGGGEARALARLEHQHIVQVFAELVEPTRNLRLLAMQFVPGVTLAQLLREIQRRPADAWSGSAFLEALDALCVEPIPLDLAGLAVRALLKECDHAELTCWLGARLAEALAHAHSQNVLHRDIKPANILVNRYGRPFLADFNMALNLQSGEGTFGGTIAYMAPEHLDALWQGGAEAQSRVAAAADLYSLAVVLFEFLAGALPFPGRIDAGSREEGLLRLREARQAGPAACATAPELLDRLLRRCLDPAPAKRLASAAAFAEAADGCRELLQAERAGGWGHPIARCCRARPFTMVILLGILPNVLGSIVNVNYNAMLIVEKDPGQKTCFAWLTLVYNLVVYPLLVGMAMIAFRRVYHGWQCVRGDPCLPADQAARTRRQVLGLPVFVMVLSYVGWLPGAVFFPVGLDTWAGPISAVDFMHWVLSFLISGLIASIYAYFAVQYVVLRGLYPRVWSDPAGARAQARQELAGIPGRLRRQQTLAVLIPLLGAALLIGAGPEQLTLGFRVLVTMLIFVGLAGFALASRVGRHISAMLAALTGQPLGSPQ